MLMSFNRTENAKISTFQGKYGLLKYDTIQIYFSTQLLEFVKNIALCQE